MVPKSSDENTSDEPTYLPSTGFPCTATPPQTLCRGNAIPELANNGIHGKHKMNDNSYDKRKRVETKEDDEPESPRAKRRVNETTPSLREEALSRESEGQPPHDDEEAADDNADTHAESFHTDEDDDSSAPFNVLNGSLGRGARVLLGQAGTRKPLP